MAVLAASGAAFAQSSVTLYGRADIGIQKQTGSSLKLAGGADGNDSRVGFRGVEDLGGGMKALFVYETGFDLSTGQLDNAQDAKVATRLFQRQSFAGLSGGFGTITLGRQNTISGKGSFWYMPNYYTNAAVTAGLGYGGVGPSRTDATIQYASPDISGFGIKLGTQLTGNNTSTLSSSAQGLTEVALGYKQGPIQANLTYAKRVSSLGGGNAFSVNAGYDFGVATAFVAYNDVLGTGTGKGIIAGLNGNVGAFKPFVHVARNTELKRTALDVGTYYSMSKRTELFAMAGRLTPSGAASTTKMTMGLAHTF